MFRSNMIKKTMKDIESFGQDLDDDSFEDVDWIEPLFRVFLIVDNTFRQSMKEKSEFDSFSMGWIWLYSQNS